MRRGEHALVDAADQHDVGRAGSGRKRPQQLDAVGVGQVQLHDDQRRLERLEQLDEGSTRLGGGHGITDFACDLADEIGDSAIPVDDQQPIDVISHASELESRKFKA